MEKKTKPQEKTQGTIANLDDLRKEFLSGKMPEKKHIALRVKLISLFKEKKISEDEQKLMETILKKERIRNTILTSDDYMLNAIESARLDTKCIVKTDDVPQVHHLKKDLVCPYYQDFDNERFIVYVPIEVPPEHQLSREIVLKEMRGHPVAEHEYPKTKILIHRLNLKQKEFDKWFEIIEEDILNTPSKATEEVYTF